MSIQFLTDSACDMLPQEAEDLGVSCIPLQITFGEHTYEDAVTITHYEFYQKLAESKTLPTTSQINPLTYEERYKELTADGSNLVVITLSSGLSGTYQSAVMAAENYPGVYVVDSLNATFGQYILLLRGLELAAQGLSAPEIVKALEEEKYKIRVFGVIDTLEYLKKGGRISPTIAVAGGLLDIKPAIKVKEGKIEIAGTARGAKKANVLLKSLIEDYGGINWNKPMSLIFSGNDGSLQKFIAATPELWNGHEDMAVRSLGGMIGAHIGPGAYGIAFFEK